jgi:hypothetical protein
MVAPKSKNNIFRELQINKQKMLKAVVTAMYKAVVVV